MAGAVVFLASEHAGSLTGQVLAPNGGTTQMSGYRPADAFRSPRFTGIRTFMRLPHVTDTAGVDVAIVGLPFDTATSYRSGARFGPEAIRSASALLRPYNPEQQIDLFEHLSGVDHGDLEISPGDTEATYAQIEAGLAPLVEAGVFTVMPRRWPLDHPGRAAGHRQAARPAGAGPPRRPRRHLGGLLRRSATSTARRSSGPPRRG